MANSTPSATPSQSGIPSTDSGNISTPSVKPVIVHCVFTLSSLNGTKKKYLLCENEEEATYFGMCGFAVVTRKSPLGQAFQYKHVPEYAHHLGQKLTLESVVHSSEFTGKLAKVYRKRFKGLSQQKNSLRQAEQTYDDMQPTISLENSHSTVRCRR